MDQSASRRALDLFERVCPLPRPEQLRVLRDECDETAVREWVLRMLDEDGSVDDSESFEISGHTPPAEGWLRKIGEDAYVSGDADPLLPPRIGRYRVIRQIGEGGMGVVFEAEQDVPKRTVALKLLRLGATHGDTVRRFEQEAEILGRLRHPGIAQVYEAGSEMTALGARHYLAMEFVDGLPLQRYCEQNEPDLAARVLMLAEVCDAVDHANEQGVVHRDLKPDNILVDRHGRPKVVDFGVARLADDDMQSMLTRVGQVIGTMAYMSPEQVSGDPEAVTTAADVYALGAVGYEMLTGSLPIEVRGGTLADAADAVTHADPEPMGRRNVRLRGDLETIFSTALEKSPERRYATAGAFGADLRRFLADEPIAARPPTTLYQFAKFTRRHRGLVGGVVASFVLLVVALVITIVAQQREKANALEVRRLADHTRLTLARHTVDTDPRVAQRELLAIDPSARGWEWHHLSRRAESALFSLDHDVERVGVARYVSDGSLIATAHADGSIVTWDAVTGARVGSIRVDAPLRTIVADSPPDRVTAVTDHGVVYWDPRSGETVEERLDESEVWDGRYSRDGARLVIASHEALWCGAPGSLRVLRRQRFVKTAAGFAFSEGGRYCVAVRRPDRGGPPVARFSCFDFETGEQRSHKAGGVPSAIALCRNSDRLVIADQTHRVRVFDFVDVLGNPSEFVISGSLLRELRGVAATITDVRFSGDGTRVTACSKDGLLRTWATESGELLSTSMHPSSCDVDVAPSVERVVVSEASLPTRVVRAGSGAVVMRHAHAPTEVRVSPNDRLVATKSRFAKLQVRDVATGDVVRSIDVGKSVRVVGWRDDDVVICAKGKRAYACDWASGAVVRHEPEGGVLIAAVEAGLDLRGHAIRNKAIYGWHGHRIEVDTKRKKNGQVRSVEGVRILRGREVLAALTPDRKLALVPAFARDDSAAAIPWSDNDVAIVQWRDGLDVRVLQGHVQPVLCVSYSPDGSRLASGGSDSQIVLWDTANYEPVIALAGHQGEILDIQWTQDGTRIVTSSTDRTVRVWDTVPASERHAEFVARNDVRAEMRPRVVEWLTRSDGDAESVATTIRDASNFTAMQRFEALRVLAEVSQD